MAETIEQMLREVFGDSLSRLNNFQSEQVKKLTSKIQEIARESIKEDFVRMEREISELRERVATLETERAQKAADGLESAF
jgi:predicted RNase H-like nuclease (RuvC/YqgF family)